MREKRREATIERIVETAMQMLEQEGFEALTIQRLAKKLGYAVGALYRYFVSKDALLVALLHRVMDRINEDMSAGLEIFDRNRAERLAAESKPADAELTQDDALLRLLVLTNVYLSFAQRRPAEYGLISTLMGDPREFLATEAAAPIFPGLVRMQLLLTSVIVGAAKAGALTPGEPRERGVILWSGVQGVLQLRKLGRFGVAGVELERLAPITLRTLLIGWGGDAERINELTPQAVAIADALAQKHVEARAARAEAAAPVQVVAAGQTPAAPSEAAPVAAGTPATGDTPATTPELNRSSADPNPEGG